MLNIEKIKNGDSLKHPVRGVDEKNPNVPAQENFSALYNGRLALASRARRGEEGVIC